MEQLTALFNKLSSKTAIAAINVSSRSYIEIIGFDSNGLIDHYTRIPINYNSFTKEFENVNDIESGVKRAFSELGMSLSSKTYVSVPAFVLEKETLPAAAIEDEESLKTMLVSFAEKNYIFKKYDPAISYYKIPSKENPEEASILYTALRNDEYSKIINVLAATGLKIAAVDSSYSALINGVIATKKVDENVLDNDEPWVVVNITANSFMIYSLNGKILSEVYEEPLAVKSFSEEEIYQVITNSLELTLDRYPAKQYVFVSQSDNVSAEYLAGVIETNTSKAFIEDNQYRKQLLDEFGYNIIQTNKTKISLEAIGITKWASNNDGFKFNFLEETGADKSIAINEISSIPITWKGRTLDVTPELILKIVGIYVAVFGCIILLIVGGIFGYEKSLEETQENISTQINEIDAQLDTKPVDKGITVQEFLKKSYDNNVDFKKSYSAIAREIPDMLWIEECQLSDNSKLYLKGRSYRMEDILNYYDSLAKLGKFSNLKVATLAVSQEEVSKLLKSDYEEETTYEFVFGDAPVVQSPPPQDPNTNQASGNNANIPLPPGVQKNKNDSQNVVPPAPTIPKKDK